MVNENLRMIWTKFHLSLNNPENHINWLVHAGTLFIMIKRIAKGIYTYLH